jgi:multicomponent K+:H+ antiporter subunit A
VCLVFVWFSAPDLALTQLLVEVATVLVMMLALRWLPAQSPPLATSRARRKAWRDGALALAVGLGVAALVWQVLATAQCVHRRLLPADHAHAWAAAPTRST